VKKPTASATITMSIMGSSKRNCGKGQRMLKHEKPALIWDQEAQNIAAFRAYFRMSA
jgi:hypothetical protein